MEQGQPINRIAAGIIIGIWLILAILVIRLIIWMCLETACY